MLVKKYNPHIDLREKNQHDGPMITSTSGMDKKPEPRGPMVHISDVDLPLGDEHLNTTGTATIKYKLRKKSAGEAYGTPSKKKSFDIEITSIAFEDKGA